MVNLRERALGILKNTHLMSIGVCDKNGPWVADVIFIYDSDFNLYWMSDPETRHSRAVRETGKIAGSITQSTRNKESNLGLQFEGPAEQLEGVQFELLVKHLAKRGYPVPDISQAAKLLDGDMWYKCGPAKIFLIDEQNFGFDRQQVI